MKQKNNLLEFNKNQYIRIEDISMIEIETKAERYSDDVCISIKITLRCGKEIKKEIGCCRESYNQFTHTYSMMGDEYYEEARAEINSLKEMIEGCTTIENTERN